MADNMRPALPEPSGRLPATTPVLRPIPAWKWTMLALAAVVVTAAVVIAVLVAVALQAAAGTPRANAVLDAVRTGLAAAGGAGAAVGLMLAFRRQHHQEIATVLSDYDATQRRITDMYGTAADHLGSAKAAVRLAGLYALERLAVESPANRQAIVNLLCAYLRMPYTPPRETALPPAAASAPRPAARSKPVRARQAAGQASIPAAAGADRSEPQEELQVRLAAQRILAGHLGAHGDSQGLPGSPGSLWPGISIDLTGATLVDFDLSNALVDEITFYGASFHGPAVFRNATFRKTASFACASFDSLGSYFSGASFLGDVYFGDTSFTAGRADFKDVTFHGDVRFGGISIQPEGIDLTRARVTNLTALLQWPAGWNVDPLHDGTGQLTPNTAP